MGVESNQKRQEASAELLKSCLAELRAREESQLEEELQSTEPHVFSADFEKRMEEVLRVRKRKVRFAGAIRYAAAAIVTLAVVTGMLFVGNEDLRASKPAVSILAWLDEFFVVGEKLNEDTEVLFSESQIGYMPEGFEKSFEQVLRSRVSYRYKNDNNNYIIIQVNKDTITQLMDGEQIDYAVYISEVGFEYRYDYREELKAGAVCWKGQNGFFYYIQSDLNKEELIKIMNGISY